jgi:beta-lactamase regulating signal transducer with metallopeptidase domain/thiol-disulfide isomerase/thioredoxin
MNPFVILAGVDSFGFTVMRMMLSVLWQSAILFAMVWFLTFLLRKKGPTVRHVLWTLAVLLLPLIPLLTLGLAELGTPHAELQVLPLYSPLPETNDLPPLQSNDAQTSGNYFPPVKEFQNSHTLSELFSELIHYPWALGVTLYFFLVFIFLLWIGFIRLRIRRWIHRSGAVMDPRVIGIFNSVKAEMKIRRECLIMENDHVPAPMTCGTSHPVIILPSGFARGLSDAELYAVARHELTHVKNYDTLIFTLIAIVRSVYFFQPLAWYAAHQISYLAEVRCDRAAVESHETLSYIDLLTRMAEKMPKRALSTELAAGIIFSKSVFFRRIEAILSGKIQRLSRLAIIGLLLTGGLSLVIAAALPLGEKKDALPSLEELAKKAKEYEGLLHSGKISLIKKHISWQDSSVLHREIITSYFEGDSFFTVDQIHSAGKKEFIIRTILCTPEKCELLDQKVDKQGLLNNTNAEIYESSEDYLTNNYSVLSYGMWIERVKISDFLKGKFLDPVNHFDSVSVIGKEKISGFDCYVVRMDFKKIDQFLTIWLSPDHHFKPLKMEESHKNSREKEIIKFNYTLINGIWFPKNDKEIMYGKNNQVVYEYDFEFTEFKPNIKISSEIFSWKLPKKMKAYDHRTGEWVTVSAVDDTNETGESLKSMKSKMKDRWIEGTVRDEKGNPIINAEVMIPGPGPDRKPMYSLTDINGNFHFQGLKYYVQSELHISHKNYGNLIFKYVLTNQKTTLTLVKGNHYLSGEVIDSEGKPVEGATIYGNPSVYTDSEGIFRLNGLLHEKENITISYTGIGVITYDNVRTDREGASFILKNIPIPIDPKLEEWRKQMSSRHQSLEGKPALPLEVSHWLNSEPVTLDQLKGKIVVLDFWSSRNAECLEAIPMLNTLQKAYKNRGVEIISIHEFTKNIQSLKKLIADKKITYRVVVDAVPQDPWAKGKTFEEYGTNNIPINWIVFRDGTVKPDALNSSLEYIINYVIENGAVK